MNAMVTERTVPRLGGVNGDLICEKCGALRWPNSTLCPACWGKENNNGTRNSRGDVIQARLPTDVWSAVEFAASMLHKGEPHAKAVRVASTYYKVNATEVRAALSQRSGRNQIGKKRAPRVSKSTWMPTPGQVCKNKHCTTELPLDRPAPYGYCKVCWWAIDDANHSN